MMFITMNINIIIIPFYYPAESNGKLPHLFISSKTAALVPEFAVENLPLGRTQMMRMISLLFCAY